MCSCVISSLQPYSSHKEGFPDLLCYWSTLCYLCQLKFYLSLKPTWKTISFLSSVLPAAVYVQTSNDLPVCALATCQVVLSLRLLLLQQREFSFENQVPFPTSLFSDHHRSFLTWIGVLKMTNLGHVACITISHSLGNLQKTDPDFSPLWSWEVQG